MDEFLKMLFGIDEKHDTSDQNDIVARLKAENADLRNDLAESCAHLIESMAIISAQQALINKLRKENEELRSIFDIRRKDK